MTREERLALDRVVGDPILFYHRTDKWGIFSNFSRHPVMLRHPYRPDENVVYQTSEHRYQAMKATNAEDHDFVACSVSASQAKGRGGPKGIALRNGWGDSYGDLCYYVMLEVVLAKARAHPEMLDALQASKAVHAHLYEDSPVDDIWGWRYRNDYRGKNLLGLALMQTRKILLP